ncbi:MAG: hypothetical protein WCI00_00250 [bacterium]
MNVNFNEQRKFIETLGNQLFDYITGLPKDIRPDDKERTGIQILGRVLRSRNLVMVPIKEPSEAARFFAVEKSVRTESNSDKTSGDSEDVDSLHYQGCVSIYIDDNEIHVSVSGLKAEEDVTVGIIILSGVTDISIAKIIKQIRKDGGVLPKQIFKKGHYLYELLQKYR